MTDAIITDPNDELYDLQKKYGVRISRSNKSDAVYVFKKTSYKIRIGHIINKASNHLMNFKRNEVVKGRVTKEIVEKVIQKYIDKM